MADKRVLITAGLPYSNGRLHVGHIAGCYLPADIYTRFLKLKGVDARYVCGSDDHGVAIMLTAEKEGKTPAEVARFYYLKQIEDFKGLGIHFDVYGSTSQTSFHRSASQAFFKTIYDKGYFEKQSTQQFYDDQRQAFLPDRYVKGSCGYCQTPDQNGDQCENCGKLLDVQSLKDARSTITGQKASVRETTHWFLDLSRFQNTVEQWLEHADLRDHTRHFVKGLINAGLVKRSMTRDLSWGVPLPINDPQAAGKVMYVWFDAPIGYISNTMQMCQERGEAPENYELWWKSKDTDIIHFVGEDNTIFHCLIWIAMLAGEGTYQLPKAVVVNQFLNIQFKDEEAEKISKSRGKAVWIGEYLSSGMDPDVLRYYLTTIAPERARTVYQPEDLVQKNNSDLGNTLGNFVNRILSFSLKHCGPSIPSYDSAKKGILDLEFEKKFHSTFLLVSQALEERSTKTALSLIMDFARDCNKYVDDKKPWTTRKDDMPGTQLTLAICIQAIQLLAVLLLPFMPRKSSQLLAMLGLSEKQITDLRWEDATRFLPAGHTLGQPQILFSRIE